MQEEEENLEYHPAMMVPEEEYDETHVSNEDRQDTQEIELFKNIHSSVEEEQEQPLD